MSSSSCWRAIIARLCALGAGAAAAGAGFWQAVFDVVRPLLGANHVFFHPMRDLVRKPAHFRFDRASRETGQMHSLGFGLV
jgi:hypothetical protein